MAFAITEVADAGSLIVGDGPIPTSPIDFVETPAGLEIVSVEENEITFRIHVIPTKRYLFEFSTSLKSSDWGIEGMSFFVEEIESIDELPDHHRFIPLQEVVIGVANFEEGLPSAVFFRCYTNDFPGDLPSPSGTLP